MTAIRCPNCCVVVPAIQVMRAVVFDCACCRSFYYLRQGKELIEVRDTEEVVIPDFHFVGEG